jgi:hypothetical protein
MNITSDNNRRMNFKLNNNKNKEKYLNYGNKH